MWTRLELTDEKYYFSNGEQYFDYYEFLKIFFFPLDICFEDAKENECMYIEALKEAEKEYGAVQVFDETEIPPNFMMVNANNDTWNYNIECANISCDDASLFRYAYYLAEQGEYQELSIDLNSDLGFTMEEISVDAKNYYYSDCLSVDEASMFKYAVFQAMNGEFDAYTTNPDYYTWHPEIECYKVSQHFKGNLAQAIQYIWRSGGPVVKSNVKEDLKKAIRFIQFEIERLENEN